VSQTSLLDCGVTWRGIGLPEANAALEAWSHKMGGMHRPCAADVAAHGLLHDGRLVAVACTAGLIRETVAGAPWLNRGNAVELARLCADRTSLCRVALRLWRVFTFPTFGRAYAVSYQDADLHSGNTYRFDGWQRVSFARAGGEDRRSGRKARNKWVWVWPPQNTKQSP
jgi:antitoxin VapB